MESALSHVNLGLNHSEPEPTAAMDWLQVALVVR